MRWRLLALYAVLSAAACAPDPVHERQVAALGPETATGPSQFHRAGQPCGTCHGDDGPASSVLRIGGTIFEAEGALEGVAGARVDLVDARGTRPLHAVYTNCVGNFWVRAAEWDPEFPVRVVVSKGTISRAMKGSIRRSASCATCHETSGAHPFERPGAVVLGGRGPHEPERASDAHECPIDPTLPGAP